MRLFDKVAIVGTGLIGGSIGLGLKKLRLCREVIGVSRHKKSLTLAKKRGAIDKGSLRLDIVNSADLLILATPVKTIMYLAPALSEIVKRDCIVTDVGSTKQEIVSALTKIFPNYVGSHPLAGSDKRSIINADPDMFKGTLCILTPVKNTNIRALKKLHLLWNTLGAKTVSLKPSRHDKVLASVSHLPHVAAFALIGIVPDKYLAFASTSLRDTTRIASSDKELWADIFLSNQKNILSSIKLFQGRLNKIKSALEKRDRDKLSRILQQAKNKRDTLS